MAQQKSSRRKRRVSSREKGYQGRKGHALAHTGQPVEKSRIAGEERIPFTFASESIANERHPHRNEDTLLTERRSCLVGVFDGVGGSAAGEIASQTAARATVQAWKQARKEIQKGHNFRTLLKDCSKIDLCTQLERLVALADEQVRSDGARQAGTDDLATTVALAAFCKNPEQPGYTMVYAHVGDSRIYLLREHESLQRLTIDDGLLGRLIENALIEEANALRIDQAIRADELTDVELSYFRLRGGITQALGGPTPPTIHTGQISIFPGDRVLLCTDGVHDNLTDKEIEETMRTGARSALARLLVGQALARSREERTETIRAKPDDISAVALTCRF